MYTTPAHAAGWGWGAQVRIPNAYGPAAECSRAPVATSLLPKTVSRPPPRPRPRSVQTQVPTRAVDLGRDPRELVAALSRRALGASGHAAVLREYSQELLMGQEQPRAGR